ncbi:DUF2809 domain-containing protein [Alkalibaculum bacchi]|nr:DUF2809 domain-containing protein [Alkalibaculum bacchi]
MTMRRNRIIYSLMIILVMIMGLSTRRYTNLLSQIISDYGGDVLWALMVFLMMGFLFTKIKTLSVALLSIIFSYLIEISQLYHAPWIDAIRQTTLGGLVLGFGFLWSDLLCYLIGIIIGVSIELSYKYLKYHQR